MEESIIKRQVALVQRMLAVLGGGARCAYAAVPRQNGKTRMACDLAVTFALEPRAIPTVLLVHDLQMAVRAAEMVARAIGEGARVDGGVGAGVQRVSSPASGRVYVMRPPTANGSAALSDFVMQAEGCGSDFNLVVDDCYAEAAPCIDGRATRIACFGTDDILASCADGPMRCRIVRPAGRRDAYTDLPEGTYPLQMTDLSDYARYFERLKTTPDLCREEWLPMVSVGDPVLERLYGETAVVAELLTRGEVEP